MENGASQSGSPLPWGWGRVRGFFFQTGITNSTLVAVCVNAASPFLGFRTSLNCTTGMCWQRAAQGPRPAPLAATDQPPSTAAFFQGSPLTLSAASHKADLIIPYPETDNWYLSLQLVCPESPE